MKITLEFNLPEDEDNLNIALKSGAMAAVLEEITNRIFRPARKHGYKDPGLSSLLTLINDATENSGTNLIGMLEEIFHELKKEYNL